MIKFWHPIEVECGTPKAEFKLNVVNMKLRRPKSTIIKMAQEASGVLNAILLLAMLGGSLIAVQFLFPNKSEILYGHSRASDGDSVRIGQQRVRILGIDAPELAQTCNTADGNLWPCGQVAKQRLSQLLRAPDLQCVSSARDRYDRALATCLANGQDIGAILVAEGLAVSYNDYPNEERLAHANRVGIWQGDFISPRNWRDGERQHQANQGPIQLIWDWFRK